MCGPSTQGAGRKATSALGWNSYALRAKKVRPRWRPLTRAGTAMPCGQKKYGRGTASLALGWHSYALWANEKAPRAGTAMPCGQKKYGRDGDL